MKRLFRLFLLLLLFSVLLSLPSFAKLQIDDFEKSGSWGGKINADDCREGERSMYFAGSGTVIIVNGRVRLDLSDYAEDGYLHFWLYVSDHKKITGGQLELTSSGTCDVSETSWFLGSSTFEDGWNEIFWRLDAPGAMAADYSKINYIRMYFATTGKVEFRIDDLSVLHENEADVPLPEGLGAVLSPEEAARIRGSKEGGAEDTYPVPVKETEKPETVHQSDGTEEEQPQGKAFAIIPAMIAVGVLVAGICIAALLCIVVLRRRKNK